MNTRPVDLGKDMAQALEELADENGQLKAALGDAVHFRFKIGQSVVIASLEQPGKVFARCDRGNAHDYRVVWWHDGKRNDEWLYDHELAANPSENLK